MDTDIDVKRALEIEVEFWAKMVKARGAELEPAIRDRMNQAKDLANFKLIALSNDPSIENRH